MVVSRGTGANADDDLASRAAAIAQDGIQPMRASTGALVGMLRDPDHQRRDVLRVLESDPGLAALLLKAANSAANARGRPCTSVSEAYGRLGARSVADMVIAQHAAEVIEQAGPLGRELVQRSARIGAIMRCLPSPASVSPERMYLCGLVHAVGVLAIDRVQAFDYGAVQFLDGGLLARERAELGFDHALLGGIAAHLWLIPEPVPSVVAYQYRPDLSDQLAETVGDVAAALRVAKIIEAVTGAEGTLSRGAAEGIANQGDAQRLDLSAERLEFLWETSISLDLPGILAAA